MGLGNQVAVLLVRSEAGVDAVVVGAGVAVVRSFGLVVEQQGRGPDDRCPEVGNVVQVVADTLDIAAVAAEEGFAVGLLLRVGGRIVFGIAVGEAVGHEEVDHVRGREAPALCRTFAACRDFVGHLELPPLLREDEVVGARCGRGIDGDIDEEVVGAVGLVGRRDLHAPSPFDADSVVGDPFSGDEQLQGRLHLRPPREGFDPCDLTRCVGYRGGVECRLCCTGEHAGCCKCHQNSVQGIVCLVKLI